MTPHLSAKFFGQFQVSLGGTPIHEWRYDKVRALCAYLIIEAERVHSRDKLAALLWPDSPDAAARKSLRQALIYLRQAIGDDSAQPPFLLITRESIQFNPDSSFQSDVAEFLALLAACEAHPHPRMETCARCTARLAQAVGLYQGDLLAGFSLPGSLPFEEWLMTTRERLRLHAIDALGALATAYTYSHNEEAAMQTARRQLALDPWHEGAYRMLMRLLAQRGQRTAALAEYERCRRVLAEELGIEPSQETVRLYEQIRRETSEMGKTGDEARRAIDESPTAVAGELLPPIFPVPLTELIGREEEVTAVQRLLLRAHVRLLTLLGPPGVGKTHLALQVGRNVQAAFGGNVFFVDLSTISDPALVPVAIAYTLGFAEVEPKVAPLTRLARELQHKHALLILDNFEQVREAATAVLNLLQACPQLKILVTSRVPLRLRGEQHYTLSPLSLPPMTSLPDLENLTQNSAVALFVARAQAVLPAFTLTPENAATVAAICARLDGLPLAIELAAARVRLLPPALLLQRLQDAAGGTLRLLQDNARGGVQSQQTLREAIEWSYDLLPETCKLLFMRLAVFANGFTWEAAEAVCQTGHVPLNIAEGIETLLDHSLLQQMEDLEGAYRFSMLQTIREFALEQLAERGESNLLHERHADYFVTFARTTAETWLERWPDRWLNRIEQEMDNLRSALAWTIAHSPEQALALALTLFPFWHNRAYLQEGRLWLERALAVYTAASTSRARALAAVSLLAQRLGDYEPAAAWANASLALSRQLGNQPTLAYSLNNLSIVLLSQGNNVAAQQLAEESLALCRALGDQPGIHRALMVIGQVALHEDRLDVALEALQTSLAFWRQHHERKNAVLCLINLARLQMLRAEYAVVDSLIAEAISLSQQLRDRHWELVASWTLGELALRQGAYYRAETLWQVLLLQARELGDRYFTAITLSKLALLALYRQELAAADALLQEGLALARAIGAQWCVADCLANLGFAAFLRQDFAQAESLLGQSLRLFVEQGERGDLVAVLERLAQVWAATGKGEQAARLLGAVAAWRLATGEPLPANRTEEQAQLLQALTQQVPQATFARAWAAGEAATISQVVAELLAGFPADACP